MHETQLTLVCICVALMLRLQLDYISISPSLTLPGNHRSWDYLDCSFWEHFICCPPTRLHTMPLSPFAPCKEVHLIRYNCISCLSSFQKRLMLQHYSWHVVAWSLFAQQPALFTKSANPANKKRQNGLEGGRWPRALTRSTDCVCAQWVSIWGSARCRLRWSHEYSSVRLHIEVLQWLETEVRQCLYFSQISWNPEQPNTSGSSDIDPTDTSARISTEPVKGNKRRKAPSLIYCIRYWSVKNTFIKEKTFFFFFFMAESSFRLIKVSFLLQVSKSWVKGHC